MIVRLPNKSRVVAGATFSASTTVQEIAAPVAGRDISDDRVVRVKCHGTGPVYIHLFNRLADDRTANALPTISATDNITEVAAGRYEDFNVGVGVGIAVWAASSTPGNWAEF